MNDKVVSAASESVLSQAKGYISGSLEELKKVQSPTREEAMKLTGVVLLIIVFISLCLFVMDLACNWLMSKMIG